MNGIGYILNEARLFIWVAFYCQKRKTKCTTWLKWDGYYNQNQMKIRFKKGNLFLLLIGSRIEHCLFYALPHPFLEYHYYFKYCSRNRDIFLPFTIFIGSLYEVQTWCPNWNPEFIIFQFTVMKSKQEIERTNLTPVQLVVINAFWFPHNLIFIWLKWI